MFKALFLIMAIGILGLFGYHEYKKNTGGLDADGHSPASIFGETVRDKGLEGIDRLKSRLNIGGSTDADADADADANAKNIESDSNNDAESASAESASAESASDQAADAADTAVDTASSAKEAVMDQTGNAIDAAKDQAEAAVESAKDKAEETLQDGVEAIGGDEAGVMKDIPLSVSGISRALGNALGSTKSVLAGVSDQASAEQALPRLQAASMSVNKVAELIPNMPDVAQVPLAKLAGNGLSGIQPLSDSALSLPGVGPTLQPVMGPMLETLAKLSE